MKIAEIKEERFWIHVEPHCGSGCDIGIRDYGPCLCPIGCVNR